jgi:hypothetical protein
MYRDSHRKVPLFYRILLSLQWMEFREYVCWKEQFIEIVLHVNFISLLSSHLTQRDSIEKSAFFFNFSYEIDQKERFLCFLI